MHRDLFRATTRRLGLALQGPSLDTAAGLHGHSSTFDNGVSIVGSSRFPLLTRALTNVQTRRRAYRATQSARPAVTVQCPLKILDLCPGPGVRFPVPDMDDAGLCACAGDARASRTTLHIFAFFPRSQHIPCPQSVEVTKIKHPPSVPSASVLAPHLPRARPHYLPRPHPRPGLGPRLPQDAIPSVRGGCLRPPQAPHCRFHRRSYTSIPPRSTPPICATTSDLRTTAGSSVFPRLSVPVAVHTSPTLIILLLHFIILTISPRYLGLSRVLPALHFQPQTYVDLLILSHAALIQSTVTRFEVEDLRDGPRNTRYVARSIYSKSNLPFVASLVMKSQTGHRVCVSSVYFHHEKNTGDPVKYGRSREGFSQLVDDPSLAIERQTFEGLNSDQLELDDENKTLVVITHNRDRVPQSHGFNIAFKDRGSRLRRPAIRIDPERSQLLGSSVVLRYRTNSDDFGPRGGGLSGFPLGHFGSMRRRRLTGAEIGVWRLRRRTVQGAQTQSSGVGPGAGKSVDDALEDDAYLSIVTLEDFLAAIAMDENARSLGAIIDADKSAKTGKKLADLIAIEIQHCIGYKFI
ncbi:hypothetical protein DFH09DRAFT_1079424 [Mycena vulgaris]|nr:hypothetical protein DFH09DRAFT_1079424 [Mycena vulgaris]